MLTHYDVRTTDSRMKGTQGVVQNVFMAAGADMPLVPMLYIGTTAAMFLFRSNEAFLEDMYDDPGRVDEMCCVATDWSMDWIRAQYEDSANSSAFSAETTGTLVMSPQMGGRFNLKNVARVVEMVKKEFNQITWLHINGDITKPKAYDYRKKLATQTGLEGFHFDEVSPRIG
jgi:uroporphyrinogen-III decarboxylase